MQIKRKTFDLILDGIKILSLDELRKHPSTQLLDLQHDGRLCKWLRSIECADEAEKLSSLELTGDNANDLYNIFKILKINFELDDIVNTLNEEQSQNNQSVQEGNKDNILSNVSTYATDTCVKKILCVVDLSNLSNHSGKVAERAAYFARMCNATVSVVFFRDTTLEQLGLCACKLVSPLFNPTKLLTAVGGAVLAAAEKVSLSIDRLDFAQGLNDLVAKYFDGINASGEVLETGGLSRSENILAKVEKEDADLVIIGTRKSDGRVDEDKGAIIDLEIQKVVNNSPAPVLLVVYETD